MTFGKKWIVRPPTLLIVIAMLVTSACSQKTPIVTSGPPSVYKNWKGSRFRLHIPFERYTTDRRARSPHKNSPGCDHARSAFSIESARGEHRFHAGRCEDGPPYAMGRECPGSWDRADELFLPVLEVVPPASQFPRACGSPPDWSTSRSISKGLNAAPPD